MTAVSKGIKTMGSKTLHQQNSAVINWRCWLMQADLYNGCKTVVVVAVIREQCNY